MTKRIDEETLLKLAEAEILGEAKRAAVRHSIAGISGWKPCPTPNKAFLTNTILQTMASNRILSKKQDSKKGVSKHKRHERKLLQKNQKTERTNFIFQKPLKKEGNSESELRTSTKKSDKSKSLDSDKKHLKKLLTDKHKIKKNKNLL